MSGVWEYYRFDWQMKSSTAQSVYGDANSSKAFNRPPNRSWRWDFTKNTWVLRTADDPIDCSDADIVYLGWDTTTGMGYSTNSDSIDINISTAFVPQASTGTLGGQFTGDSSGHYYYSATTIVSGIRDQVGVTPSPPVVKLRADNNGSSSGYITAFLSFRRDL